MGETDEQRREGKSRGATPTLGARKAEVRGATVRSDGPRGQTTLKSPRPKEAISGVAQGSEGPQDARCSGPRR